MNQSITPAPLSIRLDEKVAAVKLAALLEDMSERGGVENYLTALGSKHALFAQALPRVRPAALVPELPLLLLECVFPARRRLGPVLRQMPREALAEAVLELVYGRGGLLRRLEGFCDRLPVPERKLRRAAWDLGAELLHFREPETIPLMTRWVWDTQTMSGAVREFVPGSDSLQTLPLAMTPEALEGVRQWFAAHLSASGFYRDLPFITDLILARAYADYVRSVSGGLGILQGDFGARQDPMELVVKLLGIDERRGAMAAAGQETWHQAGPA
ncbi:hypothetical protein [Ectothiorhodospira lacustris]|uniref:hypothetical protein n=1 Tax=Ectothiorhodospira lacustris TaxID=2899127 RepID=UPI001EE834FC|nr:hypothetical protein [Ectothiorhodospira lacustris]MCG5508737.1 hypothetical protein [Ectothiorhodospira lacustris]MCG5520528.1 hypothetical protein [Ectothiorhodospira lacustris]